MIITFFLVDKHSHIKIQSGLRALELFIVCAIFLPSNSRTAMTDSSSLKAFQSQTSNSQQAVGLPGSSTYVMNPMYRPEDRQDNTSMYDTLSTSGRPLTPYQKIAFSHLHEDGYDYVQSSNHKQSRQKRHVSR